MMDASTFASRFQSGRSPSITPVLQAEVSECGLACIAMIANHFGHDVDLVALRFRFPGSLRGMTLARMIDVAGKLDLVSRPLSVPERLIGQLKLPAILHWQSDHYVVLERIDGREALVVDPARGRIKMDRDEFSRSFSGVAVEFEPAKEFERRSLRERLSLSELAGQTRGLGRALSIVAVVALTIELCVIAMPFLMRTIMDDVVPGGASGLMIGLATGFCLLVVFHNLMAGTRSWMLAWLSADLGYKWSSRLYSHLMRLPMSFFQGRKSGDVLMRFMSMDAIQRTLTGNLLAGVIDGLMSALTLIIVFVYDWLAGLVVLAILAAYAVLKRATLPMSRECIDRSIEASSKQQSHMIDAIQGNQAIKLAGTESLSVSMHANLMADAVGHSHRARIIDIVASSVGGTMFALARIGIIYICVSQVIRGVMTVGSLVALLAYCEMLFARAPAMLDRWHELNMLNVHLDRVADIAGTPREELGFESRDSPESMRIELKDVWFRYSESDPWILKGCNLVVGSGETVAIAGASGCGKTTLAKLMLGLIRPTEGVVLVNGEDLDSYGQGNLRKAAAAVMQSDHLFTGTIAENISFFAEDARSEYITSCASMVNIHEEISRMPMKYLTRIGDQGSTVSGGQRQRILIARALYRKPALLVMDEATSHLDLENERLVNDAVAALKVTRIIVAHRPQTLRMAGRILTMKEGRVLEASSEVVFEDEIPA